MRETGNPVLDPELKGQVTDVILGEHPDPAVAALEFLNRVQTLGRQLQIQVLDETNLVRYEVRLGDHVSGAVRKAAPYAWNGKNVERMLKLLHENLGYEIAGIRVFRHGKTFHLAYPDGTALERELEVHEAATLLTQREHQRRLETGK